MKNYQKDFASFEGKIWLNAASEGPLPLISAQALRDAVEWKSKPYLLDIPKFVAIQKGLKESIGQLINVPYRDVILGNSASYGLHILANGIPWKKGDEIALMHNDFPADILPWLGLEEQGVAVKQIRPRDRILTPDELCGHINEQTRLVCIPHVHSFTGLMLDIDRFSEICKKKGIIFVLNITQSVGTMPIDCSHWDVDAVVAAGYKWLCGPYGVGFGWIKPDLRHQLKLNQAYWPVALSDEDLRNNEPLVNKRIKSARKYDVMGTANFFNFVPFKAAIDYWLDVGLDHVRDYHNTLINRFIKALDTGKYEFISLENGPKRSSLVVFSCRDTGKNEQIFGRLKEQGIYPAFWKGNLRISPHVYNTSKEMEKTAAVLNGIV